MPASWSEQFALSFDGQASPDVEWRKPKSDDPDARPATGGLAWYPDNQRGAVVAEGRDLTGRDASPEYEDRWGKIRSSTFLGQFIGAARRGAPVEMRPLLKSYASRHWMFSCAGTLSAETRTALSLGDSFDIAPVGATPDEHAFSWILSQVRAQGAKTIDEFGWITMHELLERLNEFGSTCFLLSDGIDVVAYRDASDHVPLHWTRLTPPHEHSRLDGPSFSIHYDGPVDVSRTLLAISTRPMRGAKWRPFEPGEMRVARRGTTVWSSHPNALDEHVFTLLGAPRPARPADPVVTQASTQQQHSFAPGALRATAEAPDSATLSVLHETRYTYETPVERSSHRFCLRPVGDERQHILEHTLDISVDGVSREFEDVFGNRARVLEVMRPFEEMIITSRSSLIVENVPPSLLKSPLRRDQIPLVWMPWQRAMMQAYLMPPELSEPELRELSEFAMSFVERNDYDLVETLLDMNRTIYADFTYVPGSTHVETTPFEVYAARKGVCQDFANVLICLARLLGVPARYRVGYIYTGGSYENKIQSDASHAWAEMYLPWTGWVGFDPTNGCIAGSDHVRIACGRQFRDAAPTAGTIYRGGGTETLQVEVRVEREDA